MPDTYVTITLPSGHTIRTLDNFILTRLSLTQKQFWQRFSVAEREALMNLIATGTQAQKNKLNAFRDYVIQGGNVELNDDYIIASVNLMESAGLISAGRAAVILAP